MAELNGAAAADMPVSSARQFSVIQVRSELKPVLSWLKSVKPRLDVTDSELLELFWEAHPRFQFFSSLGWGTNLVDLGAGNGGLAHWKHWAKPARSDLNLYGVDLAVGQYSDLYAGWEILDLDIGLPQFTGIELNAFYTSHVIEHLAAPERLVEWIGRRAQPGARVYIEWPSPTTIALPTNAELLEHGIDVVISNFADDSTHRKTPELPIVSQWLSDAGLTLVASGTIDLGLLGEEMFVRATDRDTRSMGYWSMMQFSLYAVAVRPDIPNGAMNISAGTGPLAKAPASLQRQSDAAAVAAPKGVERDEITVAFTDISEWHRFIGATPHLYDKTYIAEVVEHAKARGVASAFLGEVPAADVVVNGSDVRAKGLRARERAVLELIAAEPWYQRPGATIYAAEAVTPFALTMRGRYPRFIGSEYASNDAAREALFPIPFEDLENLTFPSGRFDCVVTNDCLEHVPDIGRCLAELCRVLRRGGVMLSTFPFTFAQESAVRARLVDGKIEHLEEPEYHGNPAEPEARSLVFEIPGWKILDRARQAGFSQAEMVFVSGRKRAITTSEIAGVFVLRCYK